MGAVRQVPPLRRKGTAKPILVLPVLFLRAPTIQMVTGRPARIRVDWSNSPTPTLGAFVIAPRHTEEQRRPTQ